MEEIYKIMRELTPEEKTIYNKMVRNSRQMNLKDLIKIEETSEDVSPIPDPFENAKIVFTQMELFK